MGNRVEMRCCSRVGARALDVRDGDRTGHQRRQTLATLRASAFVQGSLAQSCRRRLIRLSEYRMRQRATAVDQPPFSPVLNTSDNTLDGFQNPRYHFHR